MPLTLEDRAQLHDLHARYAYAFDGADADAWAAVFTDEGRFGPPGVAPVVGTAALHDFISQRSRATPGMRHLVLNILVEPDGDGARGRAYFLAFRLGGDGQFRLRNFGRYEDVYARAGDGWRIASRDVVGELPIDLVDAPFSFAGS